MRKAFLFAASLAAMSMVAVADDVPEATPTVRGVTLHVSGMT